VRRDPDFFQDRQLTLVYIAKKLRESLAVEKVLADAGVEFCVEVDYYTGGVIFRSQRAGAFFYVDFSERAAAERALTGGRYLPQPPEDDQQTATAPNSDSPPET
jgi:hypothetical protein